MQGTAVKMMPAKVELPNDLFPADGLVDNIGQSRAFDRAFIISTQV